ncbi:RmlC-like cupin [Pseudovirgaria hyperparasitica]|uniref:RmlC-like cupin n=1 Tax=Pseudovirgaria hyperparasitica TaxID=470096 RepID=A0A6A6VWR2_9PEZI|nr:RmlC-like cupin [Pseudovirgaria hyperparasitica]KAF2755032.1 RmlC-like cupin [Pseudovirgaria hyperparasitica]
MPSATSENNNNNKQDEVQKLIEAASEHGGVPLWPQMKRFNPARPDPKCVPFQWKYEQLRPLLLKAGELVTEKDAERRVLMLINPTREGPYTTDTLYAGLQLVMPNETAPAHRHTAFAARFIIEGNGGFTAVHGKRIRMNRRDVILTPTQNWHDHGKDGSGPMIWLDALDLPLFQFFPVHFVEHYDKPRYPADDVDSETSPIVFPWSKMQQALDHDERDWTSLPYLKADGRQVSKTIGLSAARLRPGCSSEAVQETASSVYHIVSGKGYSVLGGTRFDWQAGDCFCIPAWVKYQHFALDEPVYFYRFDDKPMLESLGFYRWEGMDTETLVSS